MVQELINNTIKHAKASQVIVQLSFQNELLTLTVEDNGAGMPANYKQKGTGLNSVIKRVGIIGGRIDIQTQTGKGISIYLEFELEKVHQLEEL